MNNEIKEIIDYISSRTVDDSLLEDYFTQLEDYITNLDEKYKKSCETYQQALDETMSEKMDLEKENEDLREDNYAYHQLMKMQNKREFRSKFLKEFQEEFGTNTFPDYDEIYKRYDKIKKENERLNNIIDELEWKPIEQYEKPKYDWVLVKYYIEPNFECIPAVAEKRFDKWYNRNDEEIIGDVRYFMDMQQIDKLKALKEGDKDE